MRIEFNGFLITQEDYGTYCVFYKGNKIFQTTELADALYLIEE